MDRSTRLSAGRIIKNALFGFFERKGIFDRNLFDEEETPELAIKEIKSLLTLVAGKVVYNRGVLSA